MVRVQYVGEYDNELCDVGLYEMLARDMYDMGYNVGGFVAMEVSPSPGGLLPRRVSPGSSTTKSLSPLKSL